jgi:hypothetical protein
MKHPNLVRAEVQNIWGLSAHPHFLPSCFSATPIPKGLGTQVGEARCFSKAGSLNTQIQVSKSFLAQDTYEFAKLP